MGPVPIVIAQDLCACGRRRAAVLGPHDHHRTVVLCIGVVSMGDEVRGTYRHGRQHTWGPHHAGAEDPHHLRCVGVRLSALCRGHEPMQSSGGGLCTCHRPRWPRCHRGCREGLKAHVACLLSSHRCVRKKIEFNRLPTDRQVAMIEGWGSAAPERND